MQGQKRLQSCCVCQSQARCISYKLTQCLSKRENNMQLTSQHHRFTHSGKSAWAASAHPERQLDVAASHRKVSIATVDRWSAVRARSEGTYASLRPFAGFVKRLLQLWKVSPSGRLPSSFAPAQVPFRNTRFQDHELNPQTRRQVLWEKGCNCPRGQHRSGERAF